MGSVRRISLTLPRIKVNVFLLWCKWRLTQNLCMCACMCPRWLKRALSLPETRSSGHTALCYSFITIFILYMKFNDDEAVPNHNQVVGEKRGKPKSDSFSAFLVSSRHFARRTTQRNASSRVSRRLGYVQESEVVCGCVACKRFDTLPTTGSIGPDAWQLLPAKWKDSADFF